MSNDDDLFHMYGNAPDRYQHESLPEYDQRHASGPATPYTGIPGTPPPYTSIPTHKKGIFRRAGSGLVSILLGLVLAIAGIMAIAVGSGSRGGAITIGILALIVVIVRRLRRARRRNR